jgi:hypothetical protein
MDIVDMQSTSDEWLREQMERWERTGYGIDPNQKGFRHYPLEWYPNRSWDCHCYQCSGTPIYATTPPPEIQPDLIRMGKL